jgi:hypothetical protein
MLVAPVVALFACAAFAAEASAATYTAAAGDGSTTACTAAQAAAGQCTLRQLILYENGLQSTPNPPDTIIVPAGGYLLQNSPLVITRSVAIVGAGPQSQGGTTVQGSSSPQARVFQIQAPRGGSAPTVTISRIRIEFGNASGGFGGNVANAGNLTLSDDWILGGSAASGGGISNVGGTLVLTHSLVSGNNATSATGANGDSGGIQNISSGSSPGNLTVIDSTITRNTAATQGGGVFSYCTNTPCTLGGTNNTVSIINSTIAENNAGSGSGGLLQGANQGSINVQNSIVAGNTIAGTVPVPSNCGSSGISSLGHNLESGSDCGFKSTGDLQNTDPKFTTSFPADNGGDTNTLGLDARSPAVDAIPLGAPNCGGLDERGIARPQGQGCDIGAFELFQPVERQSAQIQVMPNTCDSTNGQATVNWGDRTSSHINNLPFIGTHTYATAGLYDGSLSFSDTCTEGAIRPATFDVKVQNGILATGAAIKPKAASPFTGTVATFTDAMPGRGPADFSATINWGDGATTSGTITGAGGSFAVSGSHTYSIPGAYTTTVTISDPGGATANTTGSATVETNPDANPSKPSVTSNGATFSAQVVPQGSQTTAHWEYGLDRSERGPGFSGNQFDQSTPSQVLPGDFASHAISAKVLNLQPNALYHVRLVAINAAGTTFGPDQTFTTPKAPTPPPPILGKTENFTPSGTVFVLLNGQFVKLTQSLQLPTGTVVNALKGAVTLTSASGGVGPANDAKAKKRKKKIKTFSGTFGGAVFKVTQTKSGRNRGLTTLSLVEGITGAPSTASCKAKHAADKAHAALSSRVLQTLRSRASGRYRTRGRYAAGTVRGTSWTTTDRCDGTLIAVQVHSVLVTDLVKHITVLVRAGHHYLAKAPTKKHK